MAEIKRIDTAKPSYMYDDAEGDYVLYTDHIAALEAVKATRWEDMLTDEEWCEVSYNVNRKTANNQPDIPLWVLKETVKQAHYHCAALVPSPALEANQQPVGYIMGEHLTRLAEVEANGTVMYLRPAGMATTPVYLHPPAHEASTQFLATEDGEFNGNVEANQQEPVGYFVKDFSDGFIFFDNKADADREVEATGALMLVAYRERR